MVPRNINIAMYHQERRSNKSSYRIRNYNKQDFTLDSPSNRVDFKAGSSRQIAREKRRAPTTNTSPFLAHLHNASDEDRDGQAGYGPQVERSQFPEFEDEYDWPRVPPRAPAVEHHHRHNKLGEHVHHPTANRTFISRKRER